MRRISIDRTGALSVLARLASAWGSVASPLRRAAARTVPAAALGEGELIHLGGGEMVPSPGIDALPLAPAARRLGLGSPSLALPPCRVFVLHGAVVHPGERIVRDHLGRVVAESLTSDMAARIPFADGLSRVAPIELDGSVALFRSPWRPLFHTLVDHLPRAALLSQPAMRRIGPVTLIHDGPLNPLEELLLPRLTGPNVELREVEPSHPITAERVLLPGYVTRPAAGAIPSWYRRWVDRVAQSLGPPATALPRRIFIDRTQGDRKVINRSALDEVLVRHDVTPVDLATVDAADQIRLFRDAELVMGVTGSGLAHSVFSRGAHIVELVPGQELLPHFFYLCSSKGLPYDYVLAPADHLRMDAERRLQRDVMVDTVAVARLLDRLDQTGSAAISLPSDSS